MSKDHQGKTLAMVVGGGPAPGINGVIRSVTIQAVNSGLRVLGIYDGFEHLARGDSSRHTELKIEDVSRIHNKGGSILRTSRANPGESKEKLNAVVRSLSELEVNFLVTIGGDDTATTAMKLQSLAGDSFAVAHVPKTIDNDLPLPRGFSTFGYETARHIGAFIVQALLEDAQTTQRWYFLVSMGRKTGHLALGIGRASGATLTVIGEEFRGQKISPDTVCDILEGSIIKRMAMNRPYGVAILAEGLLDLMDPNDVESIMNVERDESGNVRFSELELGKVIKTEVRKRLKERGIPNTIVAKDIGYELRSADPIPFDQQYTQDLGHAAVSYLLSNRSGAIVTVERGSVLPISFDSVLDPATGKMQIRSVDVDSDSYRVARHYMIRLESADFDHPETMTRLATVGKMSPEDFEERFRYLTKDPPVREAAT